MRKKLNAVFFKTPSEKEPVKDFFKKKLTETERLKIYTDIRTIEISWPLGKPLVDHIYDNIWEIRCKLPNRISRVFFAIIKNEMVLLHGFIKKTQKTPINDILLAKKRAKDYEKQI